MSTSPVTCAQCIIFAVLLGAIQAAAQPRTSQDEGTLNAPADTPLPTAREQVMVMTSTPGAGDPVVQVGILLRERLDRAAEAGIVVFRESGAGLDADEASSPGVAGDSEDIGVAAHMRPTTHGGAAEPAISVDGSALDEAKPAPVSAGTLTRGDAPAPISEASLDGTMVDASKAHSWSECSLPEISEFLSNVQHFADLQSGLRSSDLRLSDFDRADPVSVRNAVHGYLALGIGLEARAIIAELGGNVPNKRELSAIAALTEGDPKPTLNLIQDRSCGSERLLWRAIASSMLETAPVFPELPDDWKDRLRTVPAVMRTVFAISLARSALDEGRIDDARWLLAISDLPEGLPAQLRLTWRAQSARLQSMMGNWKAVTDVLETAAQRDVMVYGEALHLLAARAAGDWVRQMTIGDWMYHDLGAMALQGRGSPYGEASFLKEVSLVGRRDGVGAALDLLTFGLQRGLLSRAAFHEASARLNGQFDEDVNGRPLALIVDAEPERFAQVLEYAGFRRALALSYARLGALTSARSIIRPEDLIEQPFTERLSGIARPFRDSDFDNWLSEIARSTGDTGEQVGSLETSRAHDASVERERPEILTEVDGLGDGIDQLKKALQDG